MKTIPMLDLRREYEHMKTDIDTALQRCLEHQRWILGPEVRALELAVSEYLGVRHCVGVSSGTDALVLSLRAQAIRRSGREYFTAGEKIITTPFTFTATGDAIMRSGATPLFVDIDEMTCNIDPAEIGACVAEHGDAVVGIIPVHLYGQAASMDAIMRVARENGLFVVEDVAQAFGGSWRGHKLGAIGDCGAFSFFPSKNLGGFGDGGMVTTDDDAIDELLRMLLKHGGKDKYNVDHIGYNARIDTLQAGVLLAKLPYLDGFNERRRRIAETYGQALADLNGGPLTLPAVLDGAHHVFHQYTIRTPKRDELRAYLAGRGIETMVYYPYPLNAMKVFQGRMATRGGLQKTLRASQEVLSLPVEPLQAQDDTRQVAGAIREFFLGESVAITAAPRTEAASREVPFHRPYINGEEEAEVLDALRSGWLTMGPKTLAFEERFRKYIGAGQAVSANSCTACLHLALKTAGVGQGDEVIVPAMTFTATAEVATYLGATPVIVDVGPEALNMDVARMEERITKRTKAIVPVHFAGQPCDMQEILEIAASRGVPVIEDAAHAFPALYRGRTVGTLGDMTCFSFYATKSLTTGEGGMITLGNAAWAERLRTLRLHGISRDAWKRYSREGTWYYEVEEAGFKYNMTDIQAALGLAQLRKADWMWERRRAIAGRYAEAFRGLEAIAPPVVRGDRDSAWHLYVVQLNLGMLTIDRDRFIGELKDRGVGASVHFIPLYRHPFYRNNFGYAAKDFPVSEALFSRIVSLPVYPGMGDDDISRVVSAVEDILGRFRR